MAQQTINVGAAPNDGTGDPARTAFTKCNANFTELYTADTAFLTTSVAATSYQPLDADLTAIAALTGTNTIYYRSAANTWSTVTIGANLTFIGGTLAAGGSGAGTAATRQALTSGSGTYTTPANVVWIDVELVGGGGGGGAGNGGTNNAGAGGNTTFGTLTGSGGGGGSVASGVGGTGGAASGGDVNIAGANGAGNGPPANGVTFAGGGSGGNSVFGGGGGGRYGATGYAGVTNSGGGGAGGGTAIVTTTLGGSGGGAGGCVRKIFAPPAATYSYAVGAAGTAGTGGGSGFAGAAGGSGIIIITEHY